MAQPHNEIWKIIPFAPEYAASDHGRIKRAIPDRYGRSDFLLASRLRGELKNYPSVNMCVNGKRRSVSIHRAVAIAFLGEPKENANHVAHNDGNPANNHLTNLRWATRSENMADCIKHGTKRQGEKVNTAKLTENDVRAIRASSDKRRVLAERYGVTVENISAILRRMSWKHIQDG